MDLLDGLEELSLLVDDCLVSPEEDGGRGQLSEAVRGDELARVDRLVAQLHLQQLDLPILLLQPQRPLHLALQLQTLRLDLHHLHRPCERQLPPLLRLLRLLFTLPLLLRLFSLLGLGVENLEPALTLVQDGVELEAVIENLRLARHSKGYNQAREGGMAGVEGEAAGWRAAGVGQQNMEGELSGSQSNILSIYAAEEEVSSAFQLDHFLLDQRLNLQELKARIDRQKHNATAHTNKHAPQPPTDNRIPHPQPKNALKQRKYDLSPQQQSRASTIPNQPATIHNSTTQDGKRKLTEAKYRINRNAIAQHKSAELKAEGKEEQKSHRWARGESSNQSMWESQATTAHPKLPHKRPLDTRHPAKQGYVPLYRKLEDRIRNRMQRTRTQGDEWRVEWAREGRIAVASEEALREYEGRVLRLWDHYELLSQLLEALQGQGRLARLIAQYRHSVLTQQFEFIREMLEQLTSGGRCRQETEFLRRLRKAVLSSRLLEHTSIALLALNFYGAGLAAATLTNMVGYASSSLIGLLRLIALAHSVAAPLQVSEAVAEKELIIASFELSSYNTRITKISEALLRLEQNNNVMALLKNKMELPRGFSEVLTSFLKMEGEHALLEYPRYLFDFLACWLCEQGLCGPLPQLEIAPAPYLSLPKPWTLVVEPWEVLLAGRGEAVLVRAHAEHFLDTLGAHCNLVYWTDLLPAQIEPLVARLPPGHLLYRHHCTREEDGFVKVAERIGCAVEGTVMVDRSETGFRRNRTRGVELGWFGRRRDQRLLDCLEIMMRYIQLDAFGECVNELRTAASRGNGSRMARSRGLPRRAEK